MSVSSKIGCILSCTSLLMSAHFGLIAAPSVTSVTPYYGDAEGGNEVVIQGLDLSLANDVLFGNAHGIIRAVSKYEIVAISPPHVPGSVHVTVVASDGTSLQTEKDYYVYQEESWRAYTVDSDSSSSDNFAYVNVKDLSVSSPLTVGSEPSTIVSTADGTKLFVPGYSSNTVSVVDTGSHRVVETIGVGNGPYAACISRDEAFLFVGNYDAGTVSVINTTSYQVISNITVGTYPVALEITPDGKYVFVVNYHSNTLSVINTTDLSAGVTTIAVGTHPEAIAITPDGKKAFVTNYADNTVTVIDIANLAALPSPIAVGTNPYALAITPGAIGNYPEGLVLVTNYTDGTVSFIDISSLTVINTLSVGAIPNPSPIIVILTPDGFLATVANDLGAVGDSVSIIDVASQTLLANAPYNYEPEGLGITPDGLKVLIAGEADYVQSVSLISPYPTLGNTVSYGAETLLILADQAPLARFSYTIEGDEVYFDASESISPVGDIRSYVWNFGDGTTLTTTNPVVSHSYQKKSQQTVSLRVINSAGTSDTRLYNSQSADPGDECQGSSLFRNGGLSAITAHLVEIFPPKIKELLPSKGKAKSELTILGKGFGGTTEVSFGNKKARILSVSDHGIVVLVPHLKGGTQKVHVYVTTSVGTSKKTKKSVFKYIDAIESSESGSHSHSCSHS